MMEKKVNDIILCDALYNVTTMCNCKCKHCNPKVYTGKANEMSSKEMIEKFEKSKYLQSNTITVAGGEPFMKADLEEFILYLNKKQIPCVISTNGCFTDKIIQLVEKIDNKDMLKFTISIDGTEERHDEIRRLRGVYRKAMESVRALKERGIDVQVNTVVQKDNLQTLDELDRIFNEMGVPVAYIPEIFVSEREFNFTPEDIKKAFQFVTYPRGRKYLLSQGKYRITNCHAGMNTWYIDSNGDVYACWGSYYRNDSEQYILGNLYEQDFDTIFESNRKRDIYEHVVKNCSGCLLPRDLEREVEVFGMDTSYTKDEVAVLADELSNCSTLDDFSVDGSEWHLLEKDNEGYTFRWMKSEVSRVFLNVKEIDCKREHLKIDYLNIRPNTRDEKPLSLTVFVENIEVGVFECKNGRNQISICIPDGLNYDGLVEIKLSVSALWRPSDYTDSPDDRKLGVAIYSVVIY